MPDLYTRITRRLATCPFRCQRHHSRRKQKRDHVPLAGKLLKRLGETEEARQKFLEKAASCVPPLEQRELDTIWHSAVRFYRKISQSEDYVSPEEYAARHGDFLYRPSDNSDVAEARVLAEVFSGQMRYHRQRISSCEAISGRNQAPRPCHHA